MFTNDFAAATASAAGLSLSVFIRRLDMALSLDCKSMLTTTNSLMNLREAASKAMLRWIAGLGAMAALSIFPAGSWAAPPPPVPPGYPELALLLARNFNEGNLVGYEEQFSPDVQILVDGRSLPPGKSQIESLVQDWRMKGFSFSVLGSAVGGAQTLVFERVSNMPTRSKPDPKVNIDCCWWTRSVLYEINNDHKITKLIITNAYQASNIRISGGH